MANSQRFDSNLIRPLSEVEMNFFKKNGFLIYKANCVRTFREGVIFNVRSIIFSTLEKIGYDTDVIAELQSKTFDDIVQWCYESETDQNITRLLYEIIPSMPEIISYINHELLIWLARSIGIAKPVAGTIPTIRIDRPNLKKFLTLSHQDYWYSLVGDNSVVIWFALTSITKQMGYLKAIPGSHETGLRPFANEPGGYTFRLREEPAEEAYIDITLTDDEILIFNQYFIHKSGINCGQIPRVTMQVRYNDLNAMSDIVQTFTATTSNFVLKRQQDLLEKFSSQSSHNPVAE